MNFVAAHGGAWERGYAHTNQLYSSADRTTTVCRKLSLFMLLIYAASSGSVTINADSSVQILAEEAVPLERLDLQV